MQETTESIKSYGVLVPAIARPRADGGYELISGHRRKHACELAGLSTMPVIVRDMDANAATILMVDSNIQRENILPSERAAAYKMKLEAIKRQGARTDLTSPKISAKLRSDDAIGEQMGLSGDTVRNYISLTQLSPKLQQMVDEKKIALSPAYQIAALKPKEQTMLLTAIDSEQATPSLSQAQRMKKLSQEGKLNDDSMLDIMMEQKKPEQYNVTISGDKLRKYFPRSYYAPTNGRNHFKAAGYMDEKTAEKPGAVNEYNTYCQAGQGFLPVRLCYIPKYSEVYHVHLHFQVHAGIRGLQALHGILPASMLRHKRLPISCRAY